MYQIIRTHNIIFLIFCIITLNACSLAKHISGKASIKKKIAELETFDQHFTGLAIYDPQQAEWLLKLNADKHFTPASNTKILTYFACLITLGDSIPGLIYQQERDTTYFSGTADPSFLHQDFSSSKVFEFLQAIDTSHTLVYQPNQLHSKFGSGWAWDDYLYDFQPELSELPIYGNIITIQKADTNYHVYPNFFKNFTEESERDYTGRNLHYNIFEISKNSLKKESMPFVTSAQLTVELLADTLKRKVFVQTKHKFSEPETLYSVPSNLLYSIMMKRSDNFYAEQLLLTAGRVNGYGWSGDSFRKHVLDTYLRDSPQPIIWRDGSGLSRYNLITPESMINLLEKIDQKVGLEIIKETFPVGGESGTIRKWYQAETPYVFAKTGTLSNNHSLSGFLITNSGRKLIFSFMNNNYIKTSSSIKTDMQKVLEFVRDNY